MARFRLRFLLQEFDVVGPEVLVGRSPECHISIEDPLISRQHASIRVAGNKAFIVDLDSRNGVRVNGRIIQKETPLKHGDRVRLGTQELVFLVVKKRERDARTTGFMRVCVSCGTPYPEQAGRCPHCGALEVDEDTISGLMMEPARNWTFQLLGEVIERALSSGRTAESERLMRRAAKEMDSRIEAGERLDAEQVARIASLAIGLARQQGGSEWVAWALTVYRRIKRFPAALVVDCIEQLDLESFPDAAHVIQGFLTWWEESDEVERDGVDPTRLSRLVESHSPVTH